MTRINIDDCCCYNCKRPLDDIGVWVEVQAPMALATLRWRAASVSIAPGEMLASARTNAASGNTASG
jgi:hypothetical protein